MLMWLVFGLAAKWTVWLSSAAAVEEVTEGCSHSLVQNRHSARTRQTGPLEDHQGCSLPLCVFHGPTAPRLWVAEQSDGAGHRMMNVVNGMAVAQKVGMNFGGVLQWEVGSEVTDQHVNFTDVAAALFGATTNDIGSLFACCRGSDPGFDFSFQGTRELEGQRNEINDGTTVWMGLAFDWNWNASVPASRFFPSEFRQRLSAPLASWPLLFTPGRAAVAMHVRRGDLERDDPRATPNEYYYKIADRIRELLPSAEFHVWAAIKDQYDENFWKNEDFDGFRSKGMQVHLDDGVADEQSLLGTWAQLAAANIFVASQSSFSYIPMLLNCHCVISPKNNKFDNWMKGTEEWRDSYHSDLTACVRRSQAPRQC